MVLKNTNLYCTLEELYKRVDSKLLYSSTNSNIISSREKLSQAYQLGPLQYCYYKHLLQNCCIQQLVYYHYIINTAVYSDSQAFWGTPFYSLSNLYILGVHFHFFFLVERQSIMCVHAWQEGRQAQIVPSSNKQPARTSTNTNQVILCIL